LTAVSVSRAVSETPTQRSETVETVETAQGEFLVVEPAHTVSETVETVRNTRNSRRVSAEMQRALDWLEKHPDLNGLSLRQAGEVAGVSYSTIKRAIDKK
jgi:hypothetical protein